MKTSRYSDSQIMAILKQNETGISVSDLCREHGMSSASFYKWRAKYGGMDTSLMKRMKELEDENRLLKKIYMEEKLIAQIAKDIIEKKL
jgi:putative transposase